VSGDATLIADVVSTVLHRLRPELSLTEGVAVGDVSLDAEELERRAREHALVVAERLGIPLRLRLELIGTVGVAAPPLADTPALAAMRTWVSTGKDAGECVVLCGPTGIGKTCAAAWGLLQLPPGGRRFVYFPALCAMLMDPDRRADARALALHTPVLVCDDFGAEYIKAAGSYLEGQIDEVIWTREAECRPTVFTTNLTPDQLKARVTDRTIDRWRAWGRVYELPGASLRARRAAAGPAASRPKKGASR
jgi:DNA replication protein DnaC